MKIMTIVGTRPEIIKLSRTINELDKSFENILVNTNQNFSYELGKIFFLVSLPIAINFHWGLIFLNFSATSTKIS